MNIILFVGWTPICLWRILASIPTTLVFSAFPLSFPVRYCFSVFRFYQSTTPALSCSPNLIKSICTIVNALCPSQFLAQLS